MRNKPLFRDRADAGRILAERVAEVLRWPDPLILALPRGGVPVAFQLARRLQAALDIFMVRKLGLPGQEELAVGAIASGGVRVLNEPLLQELHLPAALINQLTAREECELSRREALYRQGRPAHAIGGRTILLVDDGLATGSTMRAAVDALRPKLPGRIIVAVPVAAQEACVALGRHADEVVCAYTPAKFSAVGIWYQDFSQTTDQEVQSLLQRASESELES